MAGNTGEFSDAAVAAAVEDTQAPVIRSMSPYDGSLTGTSTTVKVLAVDNAMVSTVTIEYAKADSEEIFTTLVEEELNAKDGLVQAEWNTDGCPFCNENHSFHKIHNFEDCKKSKLRKLRYNYKDTTVKVGNAIMYIVSENKKTIYEVPDLFYHFFAEHNMVPREFFRKAVIYGVKPGTNQYYEYIKVQFLNNAEKKEN